MEAESKFCQHSNSTLNNSWGKVLSINKIYFVSFEISSALSLEKIYSKRICLISIKNEWKFFAWWIEKLFCQNMTDKTAPSLLSESPTRCSIIFLQHQPPSPNNSFVIAIWRPKIVCHTPFIGKWKNSNFNMTCYIIPKIDVPDYFVWIVPCFENFILIMYLKKFHCVR